MLHIHCEIIMNNFLEILTAYVRDLSQKNDTGLSVKAAEIAPSKHIIYLNLLLFKKLTLFSSGNTMNDFPFNFDQTI